MRIASPLLAGTTVCAVLLSCMIVLAASIDTAQTASAEVDAQLPDVQKLNVETVRWN